MTTEQKLTFIGIAQQISAILNSLSEQMSKLPDQDKEPDGAGAELIHAATKLLQAQSNIQKAIR